MSERVLAIKSADEYRARKAFYDLAHETWKAYSLSYRVSEKGQSELGWINKEYAAIRSWEKAHGIRRFDPITTENRTYVII